MINWAQGGRSGSINRWVRREIREQSRNNAIARRARYGIAYRALRWFFSSETFGRYLLWYLLLDALALATEGAIAKWAPEWIPAWTISGPTPAPDLKSIILAAASYLISAQVGILGLVSLALALVTLLAQRDNSSTDVRLYYHASLSFEVVASSIALLAVMCAQLLWPPQFLMHLLGFGTALQAFKLVLLGFHSAWLLINFAGVAHFIRTTFGFVQQSTREQLRHRYTATIIQPRSLDLRLRAHVYYVEAPEFVGAAYGSGGGPSVFFGQDFGTPQQIEVRSNFRRPSCVHDVRMVWVRWVIRRWFRRCERAANIAPTPFGAASGYLGPMLWFTPHLNTPLRGEIGWCRRRGGVPLTSLERFALRRAFRFKVMKHGA